MNEFFFGLHAQSPSFLLFFSVLMIWTIVWKGLALWKSARQTDKWWFIALLIINTAGILDLLYYYFFSKRDRKDTEEAEA